MAQQNSLDILLPPGRLVQGSLYEPNTTDTEGNPLVVKNGPNKGQSRQEYYVAVAIPKSQGCTHWANEVHADPSIGAWGQKIWNFAHAAWPQGQAQHPSFAWKIEDGDSQIPNKNGKKNAEREGFPGHWILKFSGSFQPKVCDAKGQTYITEKDYVKRGYFVQPFARINSNESTQTPGLYINHSVFAFAGYGPEISTGPDIGAVGFGATAPGAMAAPAGGMVPPAVPGVPGAAPAVPGVPGAAPAVPGVPVTPQAGFAANAAGIAPPPPPPVSNEPTMIGDATGTKYAQWIAAGWNHQQLVAAGKLAA